MNTNQDTSGTREIEQPELLLERAEQAVEQARNLGADFADASVGVSRDLAVAVEKSSIKSSELIFSRGFSLRVYVAGGMGLASSTDLDRLDVADLAKRAVDMAKLASPDPDFVALPDPQEAPKLPEIFDPAVLAVGPDQLMTWVIDNIKSAQAVHSEVILSGDAGMTVSAGALASSTGIRIANRGTSINAGFFAVVKDSDTVGSFYDYDAGRFLDDFEPQGLAERATRVALTYRNPQKTRTRRTTLVLGPLAAFGMVQSLVRAANAESMQRQRSMLADKLGQQVASPLLTVADDSPIDRGLHSGAYDAEGAVCKRVGVVDRGVFTAALHNSYTANKAKVANTGHGQRSGGIRGTNTRITLGERTAQQIIADVDDGVYLEIGHLSPDPVSGDISTSLDFARTIEQGQTASPVANAMVAGNLFDLLKKIDAVSSDCRSEPGNDMPTIRIRDVQISSGE